MISKESQTYYFLNYLKDHIKSKDFNMILKDSIILPMKSSKDFFIMIDKKLDMEIILSIELIKNKHFSNFKNMKLSFCDIETTKIIFDNNIPISKFIRIEKINKLIENN